MPALRRQRPSDEAVVALLSELVSIDSVNPSLVPGAAGEGRIAQFVAGWLGDRGLSVETPEVAPGRPNVIARLRPADRAPAGRALILNAHLDTVGTAGMDRPLSARVEGDRLHGRGAYDMKGGLAAIMLAAEMVAQAGSGGELIVTAVADEEYASIGTEAVVGSIRADGAIVTEPTGLRLCVAHKGFAWISVVTAGRAAHGSRPDLGTDAIAHMGRVLAATEILAVQLAARPLHPLLGAPSIHASLIEGGQELSSYPERCKLQLERRTLPGESRESVSREIQTILSRLARESASFSATMDLFFWRDPFEVERDEPIVHAVLSAASQVLEREPAVYGDTPWMDAALLSASGIPTVVFGPGGRGAHAREEYVSISEVAMCAEVLVRAALEFCGKAATPPSL
jgi:acetylornithine deacetylase